LATASLPPEYYIAAGVRRAVAARELGLADITAKLVETGKPDVYLQVALRQLRSPKDAIYRDGRFLRVFYAMQAGASIDKIEIQPIGASHQSSSIPLAQVQLL